MTLVRLYTLTSAIALPVILGLGIMYLFVIEKIDAAFTVVAMAAMFGILLTAIAFAGVVSSRTTVRCPEL